LLAQFLLETKWFCASGAAAIGALYLRAVISKFPRGVGSSISPPVHRSAWRRLTPVRPPLTNCCLVDPQGSRFGSVTELKESDIESLRQRWLKFSSTLVIRTRHERELADWTLPALSVRLSFASRASLECMFRKMERALKVFPMAVALITALLHTKRKRALGS
jgi:hypothetical protein